MAEYIVDYPDDLIAETKIEECINVHERIVRCRDCEYYRGGFCVRMVWRLNHVPPSMCANCFCAWGERSGE